MQPVPSARVPRSTWRHYLSLGLAVVACPCHLPVLLALLAGTALGGWMNQHPVLVFLALTGLFVLSLAYGLRAVLRDPAPAKVPPEEVPPPVDVSSELR